VGYGTGWSPPHSTAGSAPGGGSIPNPLPVGTAFAGAIIEGPATFVPGSPITITDADALLVIIGAGQPPYPLPKIGSGAGDAPDGMLLEIFVHPTGGDVSFVPASGDTIDTAGPGPYAIRSSGRVVLRATSLLGGALTTWYIRSSTTGDTVEGPVGSLALPGGSFTATFGVQVLAGQSRSLKAVHLRTDANVTAGTLTLAADGVGGTTLTGFGASLGAISAGSDNLQLDPGGPGQAVATVPGGATDITDDVCLVEFKVTGAGLSGPSLAFLVAEWY
jgi:hypothetical protein